MSLTDQADHYHAHVGMAQEYLRSRGITGDIAVAARLGYVAEPLPGHEGMAGRVVIPYVTPAGVVDLRFRAVDDTTTPKYLSLPGRSPRLFNTAAIVNDQPVVGITEGEFDALVATHHAAIPAVAVPGAQAWNPRRHPRVFRGFQRVVVFCDGDQPGRELGNRIARDIPHAVVIDLGNGLDVTDYFLAHGAQALRARAGL